MLAVSGGRFAPGRGAINMDDLECNGTESSLFDCAFSENSNCGHAEDAGVFCGVTLGKYAMIIIIIMPYNMQHCNGSLIAVSNI